MNKKILFGILSVLVLLVLVFSFTNTGLITLKNNQNKEIKIGATLSLTGKLSNVGNAEKNGMLLAQKEINQNGGIKGKKLNIVFEDNKGDPKKAINNVNKLLNIDNTEIIISAFTHITQSIKTITKNNNKMLFYISTLPDIAKEDKYIFRDYVSMKDMGEKAAEYIKNKQYEKIGFITENSDQCNMYKKEFIKNINKKIEIEIFNTEQKDIRTNLLKLDLKNKDVLVTCTWRDSDILMKQLKELNLINKPTVQLMAPHLKSNDTKEMRKLYEENNTISTWYGFVQDTNNKKQKEFIEKYKKEFGEKPISDASYAYDDIKILSEALRNCDANPKNKECIRNYLINLEYDGAGGKLKFNEFGSSKREVLLIKVENGEWKEIS